MVALQKADTNLDEVVNDVNNLVNCTHCHGPFFLLSFSLFSSSCFVCVCVYECVCVPFVLLFFLFFFFVLYLRYMNERERGGGEEREKEILL